MTEEEKKEICKRLCGDMPTRGIHSLFCPYTLDRWQNGEMHTGLREGK